jgi:hypothetical protein
LFSKPKNKKKIMVVSIHAFPSIKKVLDALAVYWDKCKASIGSNVINEQNYVECAKEEQVK